MCRLLRDPDTDWGKGYDQSKDGGDIYISPQPLITPRQDEGGGGHSTPAARHSANLVRFHTLSTTVRRNQCLPKYQTVRRARVNELLVLLRLNILQPNLSARSHNMTELSQVCVGRAW